MRPRIVQLASAIAAQRGKKPSAPGAGPFRSDPASRLRELDKLLAQGRITPEEHHLRRCEIASEL